MRSRCSSRNAAASFHNRIGKLKTLIRIIGIPGRKMAIYHNFFKALAFHRLKLRIVIVNTETGLFSDAPLDSRRLAMNRHTFGNLHIGILQQVISRHRSREDRTILPIPEKPYGTASRRGIRSIMVVHGTAAYIPILIFYHHNLIADIFPYAFFHEIIRFYRHFYVIAFCGTDCQHFCMANGVVNTRFFPGFFIHGTAIQKPVPGTRFEQHHVPVSHLHKFGSLFPQSGIR